MQGQDGGTLGAVEPGEGGLPQGGHGLVPGVFNAPLFHLPARAPEGKPATICG